MKCFRVVVVVVVVAFYNCSQLYIEVTLDPKQQTFGPNKLISLESGDKACVAFEILRDFRNDLMMVSQLNTVKIRLFISGATKSSAWISVPKPSIASEIRTKFAR